MIQELAEHHQRIAADEENLRLLINHTFDPIWYVDRDLKIVECNRSFKKWVAHFVGAELQKGEDVLYGGQNKQYEDKFATCYQLALSGSEFRCVEDIQINGETKYTSVSFNPVYNAEKEIIGVSCFARDITEQRNHMLKIEEQNRVLMEIAAIQSHKVRGPVATILGLGQFFNYTDLGDPVNKVLMEGIQTVSADLDTIIKEVVGKSNRAGISATQAQFT
jgi:PAS domain S-box-containing protein